MSEKKILVGYYSRDGRTERVAKDVAGRLNADCEALIDHKNRKGILGWIRAGWDARLKRDTIISNVKKNPADYDITIIGTPVWAFAMTPAVRTYIKTFKNSFKDTAYIVTAGGMPPENIVKSMEELIGRPSLGFVSFVSEDFKNQEKYEEKIEKFVKLFKRSS